MTDLQERRARLDAFLADRDAEAVWLARPNSFAWLTGGSNVVDASADVGVAAVGYDGDLRVLTDTIEAGRLADEELPDAVPVEAVDWYADSLGAAVADRTPTPAVADFDVPHDAVSTFDPGQLRQPLSEADVDRYRELGQVTASAVESVCRELQPEDTEHEVAAGLRIALAAQDVSAPVVLVGGAERAQRYRHYTPTGATLGDYALVSVTAERGGLHASCSRCVAFDPPGWLGDRHGHAQQVETDALAATRRAGRDGGTAGDVFAAVQAAYDRAGWPEEWRRHHQGGAAGFAGREWIATPDAEDRVHLPQGYAWNSTVEGAKSEDTVLVTDEGFEVLTATGDWPTTTVTAEESAAGEAGVEVPRHDVLGLDD
jgi:Xaa-Pro aminopeptidase